MDPRPRNVRDGEPQDHQGEVLRRSEIEGQTGPEGRGQQRDHRHAEGPGDEGAEGRDPQGRPGPSLAGHLIPVQAGHDGGRLAGDVDQDRGGRSAVHGPVVDPGQHDDRRDRAHREGDRQEDRHGARRPDPGQDPDQRPDQDADETVQEIHGLEGGDDPDLQPGKKIHIFPLGQDETQDSRGELEFQKDPEDQVADRDGHRR